MQRSQTHPREMTAMDRHMRHVHRPQMGATQTCGHLPGIAVIGERTHLQPYVVAGTAPGIVVSDHGRR